MGKIRLNLKGTQKLGGEPTNEIKTEVPKEANTSITPKQNDELDFFLSKQVEDFDEKDLLNFENAFSSYKMSYEQRLAKLNEKLFLIAKHLIRTKEEKQITEVVENESHKINEQLPNLFDGLKSLLEEIVNDNEVGGEQFIKILLPGLREIARKVNEGESLPEKVYDQLSILLSNLQDFNLPQQKYIYKAIAKSINEKYLNYELSSPEDGDFFDAKYHRIVAGNGQRIERGMSFILIDKNTQEVLKFGNIKTI